METCDTQSLFTGITTTRSSASECSKVPNTEQSKVVAGLCCPSALIACTQWAAVNPLVNFAKGKAILPCLNAISDQPGVCMWCTPNCLYNVHCSPWYWSLQILGTCMIVAEEGFSLGTRLLIYLPHYFKAVVMSQITVVVSSQ